MWDLPGPGIKPATRVLGSENHESQSLDHIGLSAFKQSGAPYVRTLTLWLSLVPALPCLPDDELEDINLVSSVVRTDTSCSSKKDYFYF